MANVQIYRFQFLQNNPFGSFVAGDVLDIFLETDDAVVPTGPLIQAAGISVLLNGVNYTVGGSGVILNFSPNIVSVQNFNPQICIGTSLLVFSLFGPWPYAIYYSQENHYSCVVNPPTCNLIVVGVPQVVPATDNATADGSIQGVAFSTNPIQYSLGADFVYGEGQTEFIFGGLLPGSYRIYLRDSANCFTSVLVEVPVSNEYGVKYRIEYTDNESRPTRVDIKMRGYSGAITEICGDETAFELQLRGEGSQDKFEALMSSQGNLYLISEIESQFIEIYTTDPNLYRLEYSKKFSEDATVPVSLPALASWLTSSDNASRPDWNTGTSTPNVTIAGSPSFPIPDSARSENLYTDFAFISGNQYTVSLSFTRVTNSGSSNPRTATLRITDSSFNTIFSTSLASAEGTNVIQISFTASAVTERISFNYNSGMNVTITVTGVSAVTNGYVSLWLGKVLPMVYSEEYRAAPYHVSVAATDGLAELQNYYLIQTDGQKYYGTISLIKLVAYCMKFLKLGLNIRVACNLYAIDMDQDDQDDPFDQAYIDFEAFYIAEREPKIDFVLKSVLDSFGARIVQWDNRWHIVRVEEMSAPYDWREFDSDGNYITNGEFDPVIDIDYPANNGDLLLANRDHNLELRSGYGKIKVIYSLGLKPNILNNGDFRLRSVYHSTLNTYFFDLNKDGWTLVNGGYTINEGYEVIDQNNIAWTLTAGALASTGAAYIQSETYSVKMGTNNQIKIGIRYKISSTVIKFGVLTFKVKVPYIKVRMRVKYGNQYLTADGTWQDDENILVFFEEKSDEFIEREIIAKQPTSGTPVSGMDFEIRLYHVAPYHSDFTDVSALKAFETYDGSNKVVPDGYLTEIYDGGFLYYMKLEETTEAENLAGFTIVRPDDYHANNPRQWVKYDMSNTGDVAISNPSITTTFSIDRIKANFLTDGKDPIDTIIRTAIGENNNPLALDKHLIIGSYSNLIVTEANFGIDLGVFFPSGGLSITTTNILSADLIYTGYLRDVNGVGYENWARDGVAESDKLHGILLKSYALQYRRSWRLLRGSVYAKRYFGLLNVARNVNDNNRIYLPIGMTLNDKRSIFSGEFLEIGATGGGSDGSGGSPFSSAFSTGYGQDFN